MPEEEISNILRRQLEDAHAAYKRAKDDTEHFDDPGQVDGTLALRQAMKIPRQAQLKYEHALKDFTDCNTGGRVTPWSRASSAV
ncbi:MAG: hypothetical protein C5B51_08900 [Terriglobia bacterium]|nr:MAG: hypothetical protein C5B51_08900 [Terriglobia bacterium]